MSFSLVLSTLGPCDPAHDGSPLATARPSRSGAPRPVRRLHPALHTARSTAPRPALHPARSSAPRPTCAPLGSPPPARLLLGDAVEAAAGQHDLAARHGDDLPIREQLAEDGCRSTSGRCGHSIHVRSWCSHSAGIRNSSAFGVESSSLLMIGRLLRSARRDHRPPAAPVRVPPPAARRRDPAAAYRTRRP